MWSVSFCRFEELGRIQAFSVFVVSHFCSMFSIKFQFKSKPLTNNMATARIEFTFQISLMAHDCMTSVVGIALLSKHSDNVRI
jgi:hypothetical protein